MPFADRCNRRIRLSFPANARPLPGAHTLEVSGLTDVAGNLISPNPTILAATIAADTTLPTVTSVQAVNAVDTTTPVGFINVNFSEAMAVMSDGYGFAQSADQAANYILRNPDGSPATSTGTAGTGTLLTITNVNIKRRSQNIPRFEGRRARLLLNAPLAPGVAYQLQLGPLTDEAGNALLQQTLTVPVDTAPLQVTSVQSTTTQLLVTYNKLIDSTTTGAMNPASYSSTNPTLQASLTGMTVAPAGDAARAAIYTPAVPLNASFDEQGVTFNYLSPLAPGTYTLQIAGVRDNAGNLISPTIVTFTVPYSFERSRGSHPRDRSSPIAAWRLASSSSAASWAVTSPSCSSRASHGVTLTGECPRSESMRPSGPRSQLRRGRPRAAGGLLRG